PCLALQLFSCLHAACVPLLLHSFPTRRSSDLSSCRPRCSWPASRRATWSSRSSSTTPAPAPARRGGSTTSAGSVGGAAAGPTTRSEEHTSELQSRENLVCRLLLEKKKNKEMTA